MTTAHIIGQSSVSLWGLASPERLARQLARIDGVELSLEAPGSRPGNLLLVRADYLFEPRTLAGLLRRGGVLMDGDSPAAAAVEAADARTAEALLTGEAVRPATACRASAQRTSPHSKAICGSPRRRCSNASPPAGPQPWRTACTVRPTKESPIS